MQWERGGGGEVLGSGYRASYSPGERGSSDAVLGVTWGIVRA